MFYQNLGIKTDDYRTTRPLSPNFLLSCAIDEKTCYGLILDMLMSLLAILKVLHSMTHHVYTNKDESR